MAAPATASRRRLRVGVVGAGLIAQVMHLHYLRELAECFEIIGLCDIDAEHARTVAGQFGIEETFSDWRNLLDQPLDCVLVLTSGSHAPIAIEAAKRGIHVLVEKPMCFSSAEGRKMVEAAEKADVRLMVAYNKRYDPAYLRFADEVAQLPAPRLMRVTTLESPFQPYVSHYPLAPVAHPPADVLAAIQAESDAAITDAIGDADEFARKTYRWVLLDTLVHELNGVRGVLGEPDRLDYVDFREGSVTVMLDFKGVPVAIHWIDLPGITRYKMEFAAYAPDRRLTLSFPSPFLRSEPTLLQIEEGDGGTPRSRMVEEITSFESPFKRELLAFHEYLTAGTLPPTPGWDALRDITLCEAIVESFRSRMPIEQPSLTH
jgi:predicted dehydrogenase